MNTPDPSSNRRVGSVLGLDVTGESFSPLYVGHINDKYQKMLLKAFSTDLMLQLLTAVEHMSPFCPTSCDQDHKSITVRYRKPGKNK